MQVSDKITLLNCDCMEYLATLPDKAFELAIDTVYLEVPIAEYKTCVHQKNFKPARQGNT